MTIHAQEQLSLLYKKLYQQLESSSSGDDTTGTSSSSNNGWIFPENFDNPNRNGTPDCTYTAGKIPNCYNQPKVNDNIKYSDDIVDGDDEPYRHIKHYFIYKKSNKKMKRIPLPINHNADIPRDIVIAGWLQPPPPTTILNDLEPVFVTLENVKTRAVIDRSRLNRGYWIAITPSKKGNNTESVWYYLHEPCDFKPSDATESQAKVQWDATVILTCVSVLLEQVLEAEPTSVDQTIEDTLQESTLLLPSKESRDIKIISDFELSIIAAYKGMIIQHLDKSVPGCIETCNFIKSISKLKKPTHPPNAIALQLWVQLICLQLQQHMWGGININSDNTTSDAISPHHIAATPAVTDNVILSNDDLGKKRQKSTEDANVLHNSFQAKKQKVGPPIKVEKDKNIFSALALKRQLEEATTRIPNIQFDISMDDWTETTSWESIVANYGSGITLVGSTEDAKEFYDHLMQNLDMKMESNTLVVHTLANLVPTSNYHKLLLIHKNQNGQRPITYIFNNLMHRALDIIDQRIVSNQSLDQSSAMYLLANILLLIVNRDDIKSNAALASLKKKAHVDLLSCLEEVYCRTKKMSERSLAVPEYLKCNLKRAENKLDKISDSNKNSDPVAVGPLKILERVPQGGHMNIPRKSTTSDFVTNSKLLTKPVEQGEHKTNKSVSNSVSNGKTDPLVISGSGLQGIPMKIPRKNSIENNVTLELKTATQSNKACQPKLNLTSLLSMKGVTKEAMIAPHQKLNNTQSWESTPNQQLNNAQIRDKPTTNQQLNHIATWDSKNICGWGDVREPKPPPNQNFKNTQSRDTKSWDSTSKLPSNEQFNNVQSWDKLTTNQQLQDIPSWDSKNICGWGDVREPKPPPNQQFNHTQPRSSNQKPLQNQKSNRITSWDSKNICGWGNVHEISKEDSSRVNQFPTAQEAFNNSKNNAAKR